MKNKILLLIVLMLASCGSRKVDLHKQKEQVSINAETTSEIEKQTEIASKESDLQVREVDKLNVSIIPQVPNFIGSEISKTDKNCPKEIVYRDKKGNEIYVPYESQRIDFSAESEKDMKLKEAETKLIEQNKELLNQKAEIKYLNDDIYKKSEKQSMPFWLGAFLFALGFLVAKIYPYFIKYYKTN